MIFYKAEKAVAGLVEKMQANSSIAYTSPLTIWEPNDISNTKALAKNILENSLASISDEDLFYTKSILVSTNWNKNDDVFDKAEVWAARNTPSHKRTNIEHDEKKLVGHITNVWAVNTDGDTIPDDVAIDDLPNLYHLVNGAVIYTNWQDETLINRTSALIGQIQGGKKFVSMEALFSGFSYAVITPENEFRVIARSQETAFLTKHLRAYGGNGEFDGCKLGRILRNITFCGKGYVDTPANEESIIFDLNENAFDFSKASIKNPFKEESGVLYSCANNHNSLDNKGQNMAENATSNSELQLQKQNDKLEKTVSDLQLKYDTLKTEASEADVKGLKDTITSLEAELVEAKKDTDEDKKKKDDADKAKADLQIKLDEAIKAKDLSEAKVAEVETAKAKADRIATLVSGGMDKEVAEAKVELFTEFSDDQFEAVATELVAAVKAQTSNQSNDSNNETNASSSDDSGEGDSSTDNADANADSSVIEGANADGDVNLTSQASDDKEDKTEATRNELRKAMASFLPQTGGSYIDADSADDSNQS